MSKTIRKTINTITAAGALAVAAPAPAIATSGSLLYDRCTARTAKGEGFCYGYIVAIMEAPTTEALAICSPNGATNQQVNQQAVDIVVSYLRERPEVRHHDAQITVRIALIGAGWSCGPVRKP